MPDEICIVTAGSVDSGKSSFVGVMMGGELDDGNGLARKKVSKHPHEISSGKTSDIAVHTIKGTQEKEITIVDLCGHEKYLGTTLFGMTGYFPDYGILIVAANRGLLKMTREHFGILLYLKIPFLIVVTRIDITPRDLYEKTINSIKILIKKCNKNPVLINSVSDFYLSDTEKIEREKISELDGIKYCEMVKENPSIVPIISISNKTGYYINTMKTMLSSLKPRNVWNSDESGSIFYIDSKFSPIGVGTVASGILKGNTIKVDDELLIGPYGKEFLPIRVRSIHDNNKININELKDRHRGCLAFRVLDKKIDFTKNMIRKGNVIVSKGFEKNICYEFKAKIEILHHSTTISSKYSPVIHCGTVRQTARIKLLSPEQILKVGDEAIVSFRFISHPEFIEPGMRFFFREGTTRGTGSVEEIIPITEDPDQNPAEPKKRKNRRRSFRRKINKNDK